MRASQAVIPVVDLFAGPGGLGEGFVACRDEAGDPRFDVRLSIEMDPDAHRTLLLRTFFRNFTCGTVPDAYFEAVRGETHREVTRRVDRVFADHPDEFEIASRSAWRAELGTVSTDAVRERVGAAVGREPWVLVGGPPCQAYSLVGRARRSKDESYDAAADARNTLYVEYLQVLADHAPHAFVFENVKGLLSATVSNESIFDRIVDDLRDPPAALRRDERSVQHDGTVRYNVFSLVDRDLFSDSDLSRYVVRAEDFGVAQRRHRIFVVGIRADRSAVPSLLTKQRTVTTADVLTGLPRVRSGLSKGEDSGKRWLKELRGVDPRVWMNDDPNLVESGVAEIAEKYLDDLRIPRKGRGAEFVPHDAGVGADEDWYVAPQLGGVCNHSTRSHIVSDLHRYLFATAHARFHGVSPTLHMFPQSLLPAHANAESRDQGMPFADRFRVQIPDSPSTTVTSHISKDGHYFIHHDGTQCRALTVREAARLQSFADDHVFCGPRTSQYVQVGNAVPPLLARGIAEVVGDALQSGV